MIVSSQIGSINAIVPRRKRNFKAVQRSVPGSDVVSATPRQVPGFCISKHIAKPLLYGDAPKNTMGRVPLKSLQEFSHAEGAALFDAPVYLVPAPLNTVLPQRRTIDMEGLMAEMQPIGFSPAFDYEAGIRPSIRKVKLDPVQEPGDPYPTRTGTPAPPKLRFGTYDVGKKDLQILA